MTRERTLFLIEPTFDFSKTNVDSILLQKPVKSLQPGVYHTSLGDLDVEAIIQMASQFDSIQLEHRGFEAHSKIYQDTLRLHRYLNCTNLAPNSTDLELFVEHPDIIARTDSPILWVFGCSHSHGTGLLPTESTYGQILALALDMPLKSITKPGSSTHWSHRHLFNAPLHHGDTVIWQLTAPGRVSRFDGKQVSEVALNYCNDRKIIDSLNDEQLYFNQINLLNTGVRLLRQIGCKFAITSIATAGIGFDYFGEYVKYPEWCPTHGLRIDRGTDDIHCGPLSHKAIAQRLYDHIQSLNG